MLSAVEDKIKLLPDLECLSFSYFHWLGDKVIYTFKCLNSNTGAPGDLIPGCVCHVDRLLRTTGVEKDQGAFTGEPLQG